MADEITVTGVCQQFNGDPNNTVNCCCAAADALLIANAGLKPSERLGLCRSMGAALQKNAEFRELFAGIFANELVLLQDVTLFGQFQDVMANLKSALKDTKVQTAGHAYAHIEDALRDAGTNPQNPSKLLSRILFYQVSTKNLAPPDLASLLLGLFEKKNGLFGENTEHLKEVVDNFRLYAKPSQPEVQVQPKKPVPVR